MQRVSLVESASYWYAVQATDDDECLICLDEDLQEELVSLTPCFHKYHPSCITRWINREPSPGKQQIDRDCPECRKDIAVRRSSKSEKVWVPIRPTAPLVPIPKGSQIPYVSPFGPLSSTPLDSLHNRPGAHVFVLSGNRLSLQKEEDSLPGTKTDLAKIAGFIRAHLRELPEKSRRPVLEQINHLITRHNDKIMESVSIAILHVFLLIITFGAYSYRDKSLIKTLPEEPPVQTGSPPVRSVPLVDRVMHRHLAGTHPAQIDPSEYLFYAGFHVFHCLSS